MADPTPEDYEKARELNAFVAHCYGGGGFNDRIAADKRTAQALASARAEWPEWIPIDAPVPLPEAYQSVLFWSTSRGEPTKGHRSSDGWVDHDAPHMRFNDVTHWLPLPPPPKVTP